MNLMSEEDMKLSIKALRESMPCKGEHPKDFVGLCMDCGLMVLSLKQSHILREVINDIGRR